MVAKGSGAVHGHGYVLAACNYKLQLIRERPVYFLLVMDAMSVCSSTNVGNAILDEPAEFLGAFVR